MRSWRTIVVVSALGLSMGACTSSSDEAKPAHSANSTDQQSAPLTPVSWAQIPVPPEGVRLPESFQRGGALSVELQAGKATPGSQYEFVVRLVNDSAAPVPLSKCPPYRVAFSTVVEVGLINCSAGPSEIAPDAHVDYLMKVEAAPFLRSIDLAPLHWQLGSEGDEGPGAKATVPIGDA